MKKKYNIIIALLVLIIAWQGYQLYGNKADIGQDSIISLKEEDADTSDIDSLIKNLKKKFDRDMDSTKDIYNRFFDDDFFSGIRDPFKEMEKWHSRILKSFGDDRLSLFDRSWKSWYGNKFGTDGIDVETEEKDEKVVMKFKIPGLKNNTLNVDINEKRISVDCDVKEVKEKTAKNGKKYFRSSSYRHFSRILPVPDGVDIKKAEVETKGETLIISFPKI